VRYALLLPLVFAIACADNEPDETFPDATQGGFIDAGLRMDAAAPDAIADSDASIEPDAETFPDASEPNDASAFRIRVTYSATAEDPIVEELFLTDTSTSRAKVHPVLACGPAGGEKQPETCGVHAYYWSSDQTQIFYTAQQDTFDQDEIYVVNSEGAFPGPSRKLSVADSERSAYLMYLSPLSGIIEFDQSDSERSRVWTVDSKDPSAQPSFLGDGLVNTTHWSPVQDEKVYQEIVVSASDRPLFFAGVYPGAPPPVRVHPNTNLGTAGDPSWAPDGSAFVYIADPRGTRVWEAFRISVANSLLGDPERLHPDLGTGRVREVYYSPNGTHALYIADPRVARTMELFSVDVSGPVVGEPQVISSTTATGNGVVRVVWSTGGGNLLYVADREDFGVMELFESNVEPGHTRKLSPELQSGAVVAEAYAMKESMVVFQIRQFTGSGLYAIDLRDPNSLPVMISQEVGEGDLLEWELSPDKTMILYSIIGSGGYELYSIDLLTPIGAPVLLGSSPILPKWCWDTSDRAAITVAHDETIGAAELFLIEDLRNPTYKKASGPLVEGGQVRSCAFPQR
jgi:hypothetical protein